MGGVAAAPVSGTATIVLGDVAGSTRLWQDHAEAMSASSRRLAATLDGLVATHHGHRPREQGEGDNFVAVFPVAADAAAFALALDDALAAEAWPDGLTIRMRIGIHTGDVEWDAQTGYLGATFNRCARLRDLGHAGMLLVSSVTREIIADALQGTTFDDLGVHQLRDLSRSEHVFLLRPAGDGRSFPPLKSVSSLPNNLPVPVTSLVGREDDIIHVARLLRDTRLITLTGAGGSGKTRLAQHVASEVLHYAPDGAWWVDLMPIGEDERVPIAIADACGIEDVQESKRAAEVLAGGLGAKELLIVLDNCEHLIDAVADTAELLLERCPNLRIVATSRETLDVPGEHAVRVRPLDLPDEEEPTLEQLTEGAATKLFLDRASTVDPKDLSVDDRRAVVSICRRLDGMPLAIELAAARARMLSIREIESGLDDRFSLLTAGRRGRRSGARQRTLEASIAWSYELLDEDEQAMLCRLAVFPAAFDLEGARAVGGLGADGPALDVLTALVDKSLVTVRPATDGRRYRLLESIRHYALDRLRDRGEADLARDAHLEHTVRQVHAVGDAHPGWQEAIPSAPPLDPALLEDRLAADSWAHASNRIRDVIDLWWPIHMREVLLGSYYRPLVSLLDIVDHPDLDLPARARAHAMVAIYLTSANRHDEAIALGERGLALSRRLAEGDGQHGPLVAGLAAQANALAWAGGGGADVARECLELSRRFPPIVLATAVPFCILALVFEGHEREGFDVALEGIEAGAAAGLQHYEAMSANMAASSAIRLGLPLPEIHRLRDAAERTIPAESPRMFAQVAAVAGPWSAFLAGDLDGAHRWIERGEAASGPRGTSTFAMMLNAKAALAWMAGRHDEAIALGTDAASLFARSSNRWNQVGSAAIIAHAKAARGDADAVEAAEAAYALLPSSGFALWRCNIESARARAALREDPVRAYEFCLAAIGVVDRYGVYGLGDLVLSTTAESLSLLGRHDDAARAIGTAERFREERSYGTLNGAAYAAVEQAGRSALGDGAFEAALADGRRLTIPGLGRVLGAGDIPPADRPVSGWEALTPTEVEVAMKVAEGLTNKDVAAALYVSENTVKTHLKSIYMKLQVSGRAALASEVARRPDASHPAS